MSEVRDILARLDEAAVRSGPDYKFYSDVVLDLARDAAAEIRRLRARVAELESTFSDNRLVFDFEVSDVSPVIKGTWVTTAHVVSLVVDGYSWDDIVRSHPELSHHDIRAALSYELEQQENPAPEPA